MLQYSRYNQCVRIPDEDAFALVNFRTGAVLRMTPFQKVLFDRAEEISDSAPFVQKLRKAGFLVAYDELRHMRTQAFFESGRGEALSLTICPTLACNFACPYCFEQARSGRMSKETEDLVCRFAKENMELSETPKVRAFLDAELALCRMLQEITERVVAAIDFE